jgi:transposase
MQEAVRLVEVGQSLAAAVHTLGLPEPTLQNRIKAKKRGKLGIVDRKPFSVVQTAIRGPVERRR